MKIFAYGVLALLCSCSAWHSQQGSNQSQVDRDGIIATNVAIREGFAEQNIEKILLFHHPDVEKVLAWDDFQKGHPDMRRALEAFFKDYKVEFLGRAGDMESLKFFENTAVMIAKFTIKGTHKTLTAKSFEFSGKTMIVYVKSRSSPTGWATVREMIIPAP